LGFYFTTGYAENQAIVFQRELKKVKQIKPLIFATKKPETP
jgi:hypothetical protein